MIAEKGYAGKRQRLKCRKRGPNCQLGNPAGTASPMAFLTQTRRCSKGNVFSAAACFSRLLPSLPCVAVDTLRNRMLAEAHTDTITLMSVLGHTDPKATKRYMHVVPDNVGNWSSVTSL